MKRRTFISSLFVAPIVLSGCSTVSSLASISGGGGGSSAQAGTVVQDAYAAILAFVQSKRTIAMALGQYNLNAERASVDKVTVK